MTPAPAAAMVPLVPTVRRRFSFEREQEVLRAVLELLAESGYEALTMDAVACRGHTSKATIYRQWQGKQGLVVAALALLHPLSPEAIDTGSLRGDLLELSVVIGEVVTAHSQVIAALCHAVQSDPALGEALRRCTVESDGAPLDAVFERAIRRGEIRADHPALRHARTLLVNLAVARPLTEGVAGDSAYLCDVVDTVLLPALS